MRMGKIQFPISYHELQGYVLKYCCLGFFNYKLLNSHYSSVGNDIGREDTGCGRWCRLPGSH